MELRCSGQKKHFGVRRVFRPGLHNREAAEGLPQLFCDLVRKQQLRYYRPDYNFTVLSALLWVKHYELVKYTASLFVSSVDTGVTFATTTLLCTVVSTVCRKPCFLSPPAHPGPWPAPAIWRGLHFQTSPFSKEALEWWATMPVQSPFLFWTRMITQDSHSLTMW